MLDIAGSQGRAWSKETLRKMYSNNFNSGLANFIVNTRTI